MRTALIELWTELTEEYRECRHKALVWAAVIGFIVLTGIIGGME